MRKNVYRTIAIAFLAILTDSIYAEIYSGHDQQGRPYFSDRPRTGSELLALNPVGYSWYTIKSIYDGDTVQLSSGLKVRLAGINTPEIESRHKLAEAGGAEAKTALVDLLQGKQVRLELDREAKDKYGRTLAYLFTRDQLHINLELVRKGWAMINLYPPNLKYQQQFIQAQQYAEQGRLGLWSYPEYQAKHISTLVFDSPRGWQRVFGIAKKVRTERKFAYMEFTDQVDVRIAIDNLELFPPLQEYVGQRIEIRGWPSRRKDHYSILVRHPSAIKILEDAVVQ